MKNLPLILFVTVLFLSACQETNDQKDTNNGSENINSESTTVEGTLWGEGGDIGVVLSHGAAYDADSWEEQGKELAANGMTAFATEGTSPEELVGAANMLQNDYNVDKIAILGASAGAGTAIKAVTEGDFNFSKTVLLSPAGDATSIKEIPTLVVYSVEEGYSDLEDAIKEQSDSVIETLAIPGSAHAQAILETDDSEEVMEKIISFLQEDD